MMDDGMMPSQYAFDRRRCIVHPAARPPHKVLKFCAGVAQECFKWSASIHKHLKDFASGRGMFCQIHEETLL